MKNFTVTIQAGGVAQLDIDGDYYRIISASAAFTLATDEGDPQAVSAGIGEYVPGGFTRLYFASDTGQTVTIAVSKGGRVDDSRFILTANGVPIDVNPVEIGATTWASYVTPVGGFSVGTLVTPGANTDGIVVTSLNCVAEAGGYMAFVQNAIAPATFADLEGVFAVDTYGTGFTGVFAVTLPIKIPAGRGLYVCNGTSANSGTGSFICYTVL